MKSAVVILTALLLSPILAHWLLDDPGYVLLHFRGYAIQTSIPILAALLVALYVVVRLLVRIWRAPKQLGEYAAQRNARKSQERLANGLIDMAEGNWARGERLLSLGARKSERPFLNYLSAARAAQLQGETERRDTWLKMAYEQSPKAAAAVLLTQAELQIQDGHHEEALATLQKLEQSRPGHPQGLALQAKLYRDLNDWDSLNTLLPELRKNKALTKKELDDLHGKVAENRLMEAANGRDIDQAQTIWNHLPKQLQTTTLTKHYALALSAGGEPDAALAVLQKAIKNTWEDDLVAVFGDIEGTSGNKQLQQAETWLKQRGENATLLITAAKLCMHNELWGKARSYLESSLGLRANAEAYQLYGVLLEHFGEKENASDAFRSGLKLLNKPLNLILPALNPPQDD
ncbi:MAG: heme biosynthesis HemY N-terminal domain-containing protein [Pseudomonadota bacterium]